MLGYAMNLLPSFLLALTIGITPAAAQDGTPKPVLLSCQSATGEDFTIELFGESAFGPLHCVRGLMIVDMIPCAPNGGWGLSYPTGTASLAEVTKMWAVASRHFGGEVHGRTRAGSFQRCCVFRRRSRTKPLCGIL
jgi:hypothetical protein